MDYSSKDRYKGRNCWVDQDCHVVLQRVEDWEEGSSPMGESEQITKAIS